MKNETVSRIILEVVQDEQGKIIASREQLFHININNNKVKCDSKEIIKNGKGIVIVSKNLGRRQIERKSSKGAVSIDLTTGRIL